MLIVAGFFLASCAATKTEQGGDVDAASASASSSSGGEITAGTQEDLIVNVIFDSGLLKSKGEARRMIKQGAVKLDEQRVDDIRATVLPDGEQILKVGKRRFLKVHG